MKKLGLVLLLVLAACSSTNYKTADGKLVHWRQNVSGSLERVVTVNVSAGDAQNSPFMYAVNNAILQANRSPYIRMVLNVPQVLPTSCASLCVNVRRAQLPYPYVGSTGTGWDSAGHMYGIASTVRVDLDNMTQAQKNNTLCHELAGHADGLNHGDTQGPCVNGRLTDWDLALIAKAHEHRDTVVVSTSSTVSTKVVTKTEREDVM